MKFYLLGMPYRRRIGSSLGSKSNESCFVIDGLPSLIKLDFVAPSQYKSIVSLSTGWVVYLVYMSLIDRTQLGNSSLEGVVSSQRSFFTSRASNVGFS